MGAFVFDKCCFCIELRTGCFILAYLSLVSYSIAAIGSVVLLVTGVALTAVNIPESRTTETYPGFGNVRSNDFSNEDAAKTAGVLLIVIAALLLILVIVLLTFIIVLLVGLHKNKPGHVKAYLIYSCIVIVLSILGLIGSIFGSGGGASIGQSIINILWNVYCVLIIRSYYFIMKAPERGPAIYSSA